MMLNPGESIELNGSLSHPAWARAAAHSQFFRINALGATGDGLHPADNNNEDFAPDCDFKASVPITAQGFTAVFRVPYSSLRYNPTSKLPWRMMAARRQAGITQFSAESTSNALYYDSSQSTGYGPRVREYYIKLQRQI